MTMWNGPICPTCHRGYVGQHTCDPDVLIVEARRLLRLADEIANRGKQRTYADTCPCNPKNGGNGVCNCILGTTTITCNTVSYIPPMPAA